MALKAVTQEELGTLLALYDKLDDLAQDISGGVDHQIPLAELWGMVKAHGKASQGLNHYDAYTLCDQAGSPIVVVESDGTVLPPEVWAALQGAGSLASAFGGVA